MWQLPAAGRGLWLVEQRAKAPGDPKPQPEEAAGV